MMYWHFNADVKKRNEERERERKRKERRERRKGRWGVATNAQERFGRLSKTFIIFDVNYQTP